MADKKKRFCEYCGCELKAGDICSTCCMKLKLVRKLQKMIRDTVERGKKRGVNHENKI